jgi:hypothetical protein
MNDNATTAVSAALRIMKTRRGPLTTAMAVTASDARTGAPIGPVRKTRSGKFIEVTLRSLGGAAMRF